MTRVFVYGTLKSGGSNAGLLSDYPRAPATIRGLLWHAPAGYPALELSETGKAIQGEVVTLDKPSQLTVVDLLEGVSEGLYRRVRATALCDQEPLEVWVYTVDAATAKRRRYRLLQTHRWESR